MTIQFYYSRHSPPSRMVWLLLNALGIDYKATVIDFFKNEQKSESFAKINPWMQVPVIQDGDITVAESRSIAIYLCTKFESADKEDKLYARELAEQARFHSLLMRDVDNYHMMKNYMNGRAIIEGRARGPDQALFPHCQSILQEYDDILAKTKYIFGSCLTLLDFSHIQTVTCLSMSGYNDWEKYPNLKRWKEITLAELPYYEECIKRPEERDQMIYKMLVTHVETIP